ncbi:NACHT domain-containing protein [Actinoallomurus iriomotensis]|uniref:ATP-binding protein n=1 Tax=Actinoallomurus iriomotensis TaxID=478107 RepID=A0A9W6SAD8_9ACTN|nr:NACHT domain-containing protein [Actinoallomurus iriomotensis]GLY91245.1 ATP-binding protein [Actinoallomurus iriomotensis]
MTGVEGVAAAVGRTVVQRAAREWLAARSARRDGKKDLAELLRTGFPDRFARRRLDRQLDEIVDAVERRLDPLIHGEYASLAGNDRAAVAAEVGDTMKNADLSDHALFAADADPVRLARHLRDGLRGSPAHLGEAGARLYDLLLEECCDCFVRVVRQLPEFSARAETKMLMRLSGVGEQIATVLDRLPVRTLDAPGGTGDDREFERRYLEFAATALDEVELFGVRVVNYRPRATLSVAYISLNAQTGEPPGRTTDRLRHSDLTGAARDGEPANTRVESALARAERTLLRGDAGSGKSTLLRWLAVTAARGGFTGALRDWNGLVPFVVKLRSHAESGLPRPENLPRDVAAPLAGLAPPGWAHRVLSAGRGLLLVDGVDELPPARRPAVRDWLRGLLTLYPDLRTVVTSRPAAVDARWLTAQNFAPVTLSPMAPDDLRELVRHWHAAVRDAGDLPCPAERLPAYEGALLARLESSPHLRALAATPLLAAMLCALNLDRARQLPRDRMGIYAAALDMLLERRDAEREVSAFAGVGLEPDQKVRVLQHLAWQLSVWGRSELRRETAERHVADRTAGMPRVSVPPSLLLDYLLERSGVVRSPAEGRIDFVHRTVQEYLAAKEAADRDDVEPLIERAHLDQWRETIVMTAGHATGPLRRDLLAGLLDRADREPRHARRLRRLVAACLETVSEIPAELRDRIEDCLANVIPPRNAEEAHLLVGAGEEILRRLPRDLDGLGTTRAVAAVRTAWLINGPAALDVLAGYGRDGRKEVQEELLTAWEYFEPVTYARQVVADTPWVKGEVAPPTARILSALPHLRALRRLTVPDRSQAVDLGFLRRLSQLESLWIYPPEHTGQDALSTQRALEELHIDRVTPSTFRHITSLRRLWYLSIDVSDVAILDDLNKLSRLRFLSLHELTDHHELGFLSSLRGLESLILHGRVEVSIDWLRPLRKLRYLTLVGPKTFPPLALLADTFADLEILQLVDCGQVEDITPVGKLSRLTHLNLSSTVGFASLAPLAGLKRLNRLTLRSTEVGDLSPLAELPDLQYLWLAGCRSIRDLAPLAHLTGLTGLELQEIPHPLDLAPLSGVSDLHITLGRDQPVYNTDLLNRRTKIKRVDGRTDPRCWIFYTE